MICTFFGHRDCSADIEPKLYAVIEQLITEHSVHTFYVEHQGLLDGYVRSALCKIRTKYPDVEYAVVLAYLPRQSNRNDDFSDTMFPEGAEEVHPKYAIDWRNRWMLKQSNFVVCYLRQRCGGAAKYVNIAQRQRKQIIYL